MGLARRLGLGMGLGLLGMRLGLWLGTRLESVLVLAIVLVQPVVGI